jgi:GxGYxYP putative glycoside hydrolase C-terminal domain/GxGYxY sequence motif in domain of unknown function N-terminal
MAVMVGSFLLGAARFSDAAVSWPAGQLLPSFSTPAATQDLITISYSSPRWEAEGTALGHATGHLDGDGWLCQAGVDAANLYMIYGPYDTSLPIGPNTAFYRVKIDNNTADNNNQILIDVRDATTGAILASQAITRQQFTTTADYVTFSLPFSKPSAGDQLEFRVYWYGGAYIKVDWVGADRTTATDEAPLFASLKGVVNATQPRVFSYEGGGTPTEAYDWLAALGLGYTTVTDNWSLITKYKSEIQGIVVYDDAQPDTMNLATTIAGQRKALVAAPSLVPKLTAAPYSLPILVDLRGQFSSKLAVYQSLFNNYWGAAPHRVAVGLNPSAHKAAAREYATALGAAVLWLDPNVAAEKTLLNSFLSSMGAGTVWMGWWTDEGSGVTAASAYGVATVASDWSTNLTVYGGTSRTVNVKGVPAKPALQNKMYVAFIMSDGDNLQFVEHYEHTLWKDAGRGQVPMGWTLSPAMLDAMPGILNYYYKSASANDALLSGPSGYGYTYPNNWTNQTQLDQFVAKTEDYTKRAGFRVVTVWNTITGGINANVGNSFATYAPSLLGLTAQNTGGGLTIYNGKLPAFALSCNYCAQEQNVRDFIASAAAGWPGNAPRFILIQAQPWQGVTPTSFLNVKNSLDGNYVVVRPDTWFQLLREANGLPIDPAPTPAPTPAPGTWTLCANEGGTCTFTGTRQVRYGSGGTYNYGTFTSSVACTNTVFNDPVPGVAKTCEYNTPPGSTATATATARPTATPTPTSAARATPTSTARPTPTARATATPTATTSAGACAGVPAFASCTAYANGAKVVFNNTLYHAIVGIPANRDCPPNSPFDPSNDNWWVNDGGC